MMEYQPRPNTGTLFSNKTKMKQTSPDYSGELIVDANSLVIVDGIAKLRVAGWKKVGKSGATFLSLALSTPQQDGARPASVSSAPLADVEDDIPF